MQIIDRIKAFSQLGNILLKFVNNFESESPCDDDLNTAVVQSFQANPWFTSSNQIFALKEWGKALTEENLSQWLSKYTVQEDYLKTIGIICAGNIPLVGFHDVLSVLICGHSAKIKLSSKDKYLIPSILRKLIQIEPLFKSNIEYIERLTDFDAVIATGSNNTARYFDIYFKGKPNIIRRNRTSIAVLSGNESKEELAQLGEDVFRYFGMGCRNVTKLFIPNDYDIDQLYNAFFEYKEVVYHNKYGNNYDYHKAIFLMNQDVFFDNGFLLLKESNALFSPLATLHFEKYKDLFEVDDFKNEHKQEIQCCVGYKQALNFGKAQHPNLWDYADSIDTIQFLTEL